VNFYKLTNSLLYPTNPDTGEPLHHKFDNSGFFCSGHESAGNTVDKFNRFFWRMGMENFQKFFSVLATMKTKSLSLTKQELKERKQLEVTLDGLQLLIKITSHVLRHISRVAFRITAKKPDARPDAGSWIPVATATSAQKSVNGTCTSIRRKDGNMSNRNKLLRRTPSNRNAKRN
jgi:hypothetical protein